MNKYLLIVLVILWLVVGFASFVYWWTKESEFTSEQVGIACYSSLIGPLNFFVGWLICGDLGMKPARMLFKKRK